MAITLDQPLGSGSTNGTLSVSFTTTATAAAGSRVVVCFSFFQSGTPTLTCTIGGTGATKDKQFDNGSDHYAIFSLVLGGSLASGSTITCSSTGSGPGGFLAAACSYLGTTSVDTTASNSTTGTGWSSGSATNSIADALFVGGAGNETASSTTSTPTNGTERFDIWNSAAGQGMAMHDLIASSVASQALTGTWSTSSTATTGALVIYKGTAAAAAGPAFTPQRMPLGA